MRHSIQFQSSPKAPGLRPRSRARRAWEALADSPLLRLLVALGILTSLYTTLFLLMGGW